MTRKEALIRHLLSGRKVSIKTAYTLFGISNISREIRRLVETPLGVELKRDLKTGKTKYGQSCYWFEYSVTPSGRKKLLAYLKKQK